MVDDDRAYSLTYGLVAPRVVVSRGLVERTNADQLQAVFAHERYHVRNLDPLKVLVARVLSSGLFFLPALQDLHDRYLAGRELAADRAAYRACGKPPLAGALYQVAASPEPATAGPAAAIGGSDFLEARLAQLEAGREPPMPVIPRWSVVATGVGIVAMTAAIALTAAGVARFVAGSSLAGDGALGLVGPLACGVVWVLAAALLWRRVARRPR
jgi:beta-lactamase regulating signal transducer with metallopeptidase domain